MKLNIEISIEKHKWKVDIILSDDRKDKNVLKYLNKTKKKEYSLKKYAKFSVFYEYIK